MFDQSMGLINQVVSRVEGLINSWVIHRSTRTKPTQHELFHGYLIGSEEPIRVQRFGPFQTHSETK